VLAVLLYHLDVEWAEGGYLGVEVFFVLSGYLITGLLLREWRTSSRIDLPAFYIRRARRLLPAVITLIVVVCGASIVLARSDLASIRGDALASLFYVQNWWAILSDQSYFEVFGRPSPLQHLWSLAIEEQFYLFWPVLLTLALRAGGRARSFVFTLVLAGASVFLMLSLADVRSIDRVYYGTDTRSFGLLFGAAFAFIWAPGSRAARRTTGLAADGLDALAVLALVSLVWQLSFRSEFDPWTFPWGLLWVDVLTLVLIAAAATGGSIVGGGLSRPVLVAIGKRSYSLYLWHWPVFVFLRPGIDVSADGWAVQVARLALTFALAEVSYRYVEQPFRDGRVGRWLQGVPRRVPRAKRQRFAAASALLVCTFVTGLMVLPTDPAPDGPTQIAIAPEPVGASTVPDVEPPHRSPAPTTAVPTTTTAAPKPAGPSAVPITVIGESVTLGAAPELQRRFTTIGINAQEARQVDASLDVVTWLSAEGTLQPTVVMHVGNNGVLPDGSLERLLELVGPDRHLVLVTVSVPRRWESQVNDALRAFVDAHPDVTLADWKAVVAKDPGVLVRDQVHLSEHGFPIYADLIEQAVTP
jgi:peptidoglycan/LPS O-acetylase OafA/YrhL